MRPALRSVRRHACRTSAGWSHTRKDRHSEVHRRSAARITRVGHALACPNWPKGCSRHGLPAPVRFTRTIRVSDALHQRCDRPISLLAAGRTCPAPTPLRRAGHVRPAASKEKSHGQRPSRSPALSVVCAVIAVRGAEPVTNAIAGETTPSASQLKKALRGDKQEEVK